MGMGMGMGMIFRLGNLFRYLWMDGEHHGRERRCHEMMGRVYDCDYD